MARDLNKWRTEGVATWIGAGGDDHLSPLHASVQTTLAVEGAAPLTARPAHLAPYSLTSSNDITVTSPLHAAPHYKRGEGGGESLWTPAAPAGLIPLMGGTAPSHQPQESKMDLKQEFPLKAFQNKTLHQ